MHTSLADDIWVVANKEWREWLAARGRLGQRLGGIAIFLAVCGLSALAILRVEGFSRAVAIVIGLWLPLLLATGYAADSFAGERERRTLEMLLATRLPGKAIFLGKVAAAAAYGWLLMVACWLLGLAFAGLGLGWSAGELIGGLAPALFFVGLPLAILTASVGVWVSARARTVRQAQWLLTVWVAILLTASIGAAWGADPLAAPLIATFGEAAVLAAVGLGLLLVDAVLLISGIWRLCRSGLLT